MQYKADAANTLRAACLTECCQKSGGHKPIPIVLPTTIYTCNLQSRAPYNEEGRAHDLLAEQEHTSRMHCAASRSVRTMLATLATPLALALLCLTDSLPHSHVACQLAFSEVQSLYNHCAIIVQ